MSQAFEAVWARIIQRLRPGETIRNWGLARDYTGRTFKIEHVGNSSILVFGGKMKSARNVTKGDFANIYAVWDAYRVGKYPRGEMMSLSQNSTYIISILHHIEAS